MQRPDRHLRVCVLVAALQAAACDAGTGGRPVIFRMALEAPASDEQHARGRFRTSTGWEIEVSEACIAVGPVYLWAGAAHLAYRSGWWPPRLVRVAHAHPGDNHFAGGQVRGEWVAQTTFDVLPAGPLVVPGLNGLAGPVRSFSLMLDPPRGELQRDPCLRGHHAYAVGVARRGDAIVSFEGGLDIDDVGTSRRVDGVALEGTLADDSEVVISLHLAAWFDGAQFDKLTTRNQADRFVITADSQVRAAWFIGSRGARAFSGRIRSPAPAN